MAMTQTTIRTADREALVACAVTVTGSTEWRLLRQGEPTKVFKSRSAALRAANRWIGLDEKDEVF